MAELKKSDNRTKNGGKRQGSGRKEAVQTAKTREIAAKELEKGISPLEVMLEAMRYAYGQAQALQDPIQKTLMLNQAAEHAHKAAPYLHPRLQPVDGRGSTDMNINVIIRRGLADGD